MRLTLLGVPYSVARRGGEIFLRKDAQLGLFGESKELRPKQRRSKQDRRKKRRESPEQGSLFDTGDLISMDSLTPAAKGRKGGAGQGGQCDEKSGWFGLKGSCDRRKRNPGGTDEPKKASRSNKISMAKQELAHAQRDFELAGKLYGNTNTSLLSPEEFKRARQLGLDKGVNYAALENLRKQEFEARQRLESFMGSNQKIEPRERKVAKGPMSEAEANAPFTPEERKKLASTFEPPDTKDVGRIDLAASRSNAALSLEKIRYLPGYAKVRVEDIQAIRSYTGNGYVGINGAMRGMQVDPSTDLAARQRLAARATQQAIAKLPKYEGEIRRDTRLSKAEIERDFRVGNTVSFKGLTSASADMSGDAAGSYGSQDSYSKASFYGDKSVRNGIKQAASGKTEQVEFRIQAKSGRDISPFSTRAHEREILLPHGWQGKVSKVESVQGRTVIHMEEI